MNKSTIIELVLWKSVEGVSDEEVKTSIAKLNDFVMNQPGFVSRQTALSEDHQFVDVVLWQDLVSATTASEKAMQNAELSAVFALIDEKEMLFKHYEIFNSLEGVH